MRFALAILTIAAGLLGAAREALPPSPDHTCLAASSGAHPQSQVQPAQQQPARDIKPVQPTGGGVIRGRVLGATTREPLRHARVWLRPAGFARDISTLTDLEGRFELAQVPPGRYRLVAEKRSHLTLEYGQRHAREPGKPIDLSNGQTIEGVDLVLPSGGVIAGTVVDDLGEPVQGVTLTVLQRQFVQEERRLVPVAQPGPERVQPNDLGRYRIYGLPPGTYYVGAMPLGSDASVDDGVKFAPAYYPSTADIAQAEPIVLKVGQQRLNVDLVLMAARPSRVSGVVVNSLGQPVANAAVTSWQSIADSSYTSSTGPRATTRADGRFTLSNMRPGLHTLGVDATNPQTGETEHARMTVNVAGADVDAVVLATAANVSAAGRIRFEPGLAARFPSSRLSVIGYATAAMLPAFSPATQPDWSFTLRGIPPGPLRRFGVTDPPAGWRVGAVYCGGRDITDTGIDIAANQNLSGIEIVLTNRTTELTGVVTDADGQKTTDCTVVVFSEDSTRWVPGSQSLRAGRPDQNGRVIVRDLRPGGYFVIALDYLQQGDEYDPEVLRALQTSATRFTLKDGEKKSLELRIANVDR
jgi:hypothetical protein